MACSPASDTKTITASAGGTITLACPLGNASIAFASNTLNGVAVTLASTGVTPHPPAGLGIRKVIGERFDLSPHPQAFMYNPPIPSRKATLTLPYDNTGVGADKQWVFIIDPNGWQPLPSGDHTRLNGRLLNVKIASIAASGQYVVVEML